jgi:hypothetical protein
MKLKQNKQLNHKHIKIKKKQKKNIIFLDKNKSNTKNIKKYDKHLNRNLANTNLKPNKFSCNQGQVFVCNHA